MSIYPHLVMPLVVAPPLPFRVLSACTDCVLKPPCACSPYIPTYIPLMRFSVRVL